MESGKRSVITMKFLLSAAVVLLVVVVISAQYSPPVPEVDQSCLECICKASTDCDPTIKCHNGGGNSYFCGPYLISWAYWHDGGRPGYKGRPNDFETCLNNKTCAEQAVRGYMRRYGKDCDNSGEIDCYDFARIHKEGYVSCGNTAIEGTDYWEKFEVCHNPSYNDDDDEENDYGEGVINARKIDTSKDNRFG